ncbi:helix-turn-helix transcriptional regulator [Longispora sp. NPDC051575]|uniref:helix-turn-helix transcriptional regulator n=1 Tax=Longispora sp. NPDC051575 TaxID=3154943 RepID=UPI0034391645
MYESLAELLHRRRRARGWSQHRLARELNTLTGRPTLTRHEVSRWERSRRLPGPFWRGGLAALLGLSEEELRAASAAGRRRRRVRTRPR